MLAAIIAAPATASPASSVVHYVVKAGDTPSVLAARYLSPPHGWRDLLRLARTRDPRALPTGQSLAIPVEWLRAIPGKANLAGFRGRVTVTIAGKNMPPKTGMTLGEGARIETAANSFATLALPNGSRISLPSQSDVTVAKLRKLVLGNTIMYRFQITRGRVDTQVTPLKGPSGHYTISTPISMTAVRGTDYAVSYDPGKKVAGTEVFAGTVAVSPPSGAHPLLVPKSFGATIDAKGQNEKAALLSAPDLIDPGKAQHDDLVTLNLTPVSGANNYHILLATDAGFIDAYREQDSATPRFEVENVPDGNQFVRISAIAANGLEGQRQSYAFVRQLASIHAAAAATPTGYQFKWFGAGQGQRRYHLRIFPGAPEGTPIVDEVALQGNEVNVEDLPPGVYFWQVATIQTGSSGTIENWTDPEKLTIAAVGDD